MQRSPSRGLGESNRCRALRRGGAVRLTGETRSRRLRAPNYRPPFSLVNGGLQNSRLCATRSARAPPRSEVPAVTLPWESQLSDRPRRTPLPRLRTLYRACPWHRDLSRGIPENTRGDRVFLAGPADELTPSEGARCHLVAYGSNVPARGRGRNYLDSVASVRSDGAPISGGFSEWLLHAEEEGDVRVHIAGAPTPNSFPSGHWPG